jgi:hypothetical protein
MPFLALCQDSRCSYRFKHSHMLILIPTCHVTHLIADEHVDALFHHGVSVHAEGLIAHDQHLARR